MNLYEHPSGKELIWNREGEGKCCYCNGRGKRYDSCAQAMHSCEDCSGTGCTDGISNEDFLIEEHNKLLNEALDINGKYHDLLEKYHALLGKSIIEEAIQQHDNKEIITLKENNHASNA